MARTEASDVEIQRLLRVGLGGIEITQSHFGSRKAVQHSREGVKTRINRLAINIESLFQEHSRGPEHFL